MVEREAFLSGGVFTFPMSDCALCEICAGRAGEPCCAAGGDRICRRFNA